MFTSALSSTSLHFTFTCYSLFVIWQEINSLWFFGLMIWQFCVSFSTVLVQVCPIVAVFWGPLVNQKVWFGLSDYDFLLFCGVHLIKFLKMVLLAIAILVSIVWRGGGSLGCWMHVLGIMAVCTYDDWFLEFFSPHLYLSFYFLFALVMFSFLWGLLGIIKAYLISIWVSCFHTD